LVTTGVWQSVRLSATLCRVLTVRLARALAAPAVAAALVVALAGPAFALDTEITSGPADGAVLLPGPVTYTFTANEGGYSFECSVDNAAFASCSSPATYDLPPGTHVLRVRYVGLGTDPTPAQRSWVIRNVPCEQAGAAYQAAQGQLLEQQQKLAKAKKKLRRAHKHGTAAQVKRAKNKVRKIKAKVAEHQSAVNAAAAQQQAVC
jgi:hypothetical protein